MAIINVLIIAMIACLWTFNGNDDHGNSLYDNTQFESYNSFMVSYMQWPGRSHFGPILRSKP